MICYIPPTPLVARFTLCAPPESELLLDVRLIERASRRAMFDRRSLSRHEFDLIEHRWLRFGSKVIDIGSAGLFAYSSARSKRLGTMRWGARERQIWALKYPIVGLVRAWRPPVSNSDSSLHFYFASRCFCLVLRLQSEWNIKNLGDDLGRGRSRINVNDKCLRPGADDRRRKRRRIIIAAKSFKHFTLKSHFVGSSRGFAWD